MVAFQAACQSDKPAAEIATKENSAAQISGQIDFSKLRKTIEDEVIFPQGQTIKVDKLAPIPMDNMPKLIYEGYINGSFVVKQLGSDGKELEEYLPMHFHWDNYEPIKITSGNIPFNLPEKDHLLAIYLIDESGYRIQGDSAYVSKMIRVADGQISRIDDSSMLLYYNQPRYVYPSTDPYIILDFLVTNEANSGMDGILAKIDGQTFPLYQSGTYMIKGLKPGEHYAELVIYRQGEPYFGPLSPSRMKFIIKK
jgi:hypothetical protein